MNKAEFFIKAINAGKAKKKSWIIAAFSIKAPVKPSEVQMSPWDIIYLADENNNIKRVAFFDGDAQEITLSDYSYDHTKPEPPFKFKDRIVLNPGDLVNVKEKMDVPYGNVLANWLWLIFPYGDRFDFIRGRFSARTVEDLVEPLLKSTPPPGTPRDPKYVYVDQHLEFTRVKGLIDGISQLCVPSSSEKALTHHPDRDKVRAELIEKYKGRLNDPAVAAAIDKRMVELDREWLKGDPSEGFFIDSKSVEIARKKTHGLMGLEQGFTDAGEEATFIGTALSDGWDREKLPAIVNNLREGSYDRGLNTAFGGKGTKDLTLVMQNSVIAERDCKSKVGIDVVIEERYKKFYIGNYIIQGDGLVNITAENVKDYIGKPIVMRTPAYCKTKGEDYCEVCIGDRYKEHKTGLTVAATSITARFMLIKMKKAHGKVLKTVEYDFASDLT